FIGLRRFSSRHSPSDVCITTQLWTCMQASYSSWQNSIRHRTDSSWRTFTNSTPVLALLVRPFHPIGHVLVAVICFVNLFHAIEGAFALAHFFVNDSEVVDDFLFRPIHR